MKLWTIKSGECVLTEEAHGDKAWALCVGPEAKPGETDPALPAQLQVVTGGADSTITVWEDCSQLVEETRKKQEVFISIYETECKETNSQHILGRKSISRAAA
jgi:U3 small nucleolar RNA-associated protein 13